MFNAPFAMLNGDTYEDTFLITFHPNEPMTDKVYNTAPLLPANDIMYSVKRVVREDRPNYRDMNGYFFYRQMPNEDLGVPMYTLIFDRMNMKRFLANRDIMPVVGNVALTFTQSLQGKVEPFYYAYLADRKTWKPFSQS